MDCSGGARLTSRTIASLLPYNLTPSQAADSLVAPAAAHRLDAPVGGLLVVAKTGSAARALHTAFSERQVQKTYVAIVAGKPEHACGEVNDAFQTLL